MTDRKKKSEYQDIINLPHHVSEKHLQMSMHDRAAQFAPFAALTGYDSVIQEMGQLTCRRIELDETALEVLNLKMQILTQHLEEQPELTVIYFLPNLQKSGGSYETMTGIISGIDENRRILIMQDGSILPMDDIYTLEGDIFSGLDEIH